MLQDLGLLKYHSYLNKVEQRNDHRGQKVLLLKSWKCIKQIFIVGPKKCNYQLFREKTAAVKNGEFKTTPKLFFRNPGRKFQPLVVPGTNAIKLYGLVIT